ncbi:MAG: hypothetical protein ACOH1N_12545 [Lutibacter sp.]
MHSKLKKIGNTQMMKPRFKKRKKPNFIRGIVLAILLLVIIYLWMNVESIINLFFGVKN